MITAYRASAPFADVDVKEDLFEVQGGIVQVHLITGEVTDTLTSGIDFSITPPGIAGGTVSGALLAAGSLLSTHPLGTPTLFKTGDKFSLKVEGNNDGRVAWTVLYEQITRGSRVVPVSMGT